MKITDLKNRIKKIPLRIWILALIVAVGIFLRTYHFHDWLVFNPDQARDARIVNSVASGKHSWLILGPEAGNTRFDLGPWFYHLETIAVKFFGNAPDKLAYPDLIFSILTIPLFYFFLKKYFSSNLSLSLTGLFAVSYFAVRYSRFAWNPNSIPFFVLLFLLGILYLSEEDTKKSFWGAVLVGIGIGVGIQLHILLFYMFLFVAGLFFLYLFFRKLPILSIVGKVAIVFLIILITNAGQVAYEMKYGLYNTRKFVRSSTKSTVKIKTGENLQRDLLCMSQSNLHLISSLGNPELCDSQDTLAKLFADRQVFFIYSQNKKALGIICAGAFFSLAGFILLAYFWRTESDRRKREFLALVGLYSLATLLAMFPVINQVEPRYYIVSLFLPFVFLGLVAKGLLCLGKKWPIAAVGVALVFLAALNISTEVKAAETFFAGKANNDRYSYLGETEAIANYLAAHANGSKIIYLRGDREYEKRYFGPLEYILSRQGFDLANPTSDEEMSPDAPIFFIAETIYNKHVVGSKIGGYRRVEQRIQFQNVTIIVSGEDKGN